MDINQDQNTNSEHSASDSPDDSPLLLSRRDPDVGKYASLPPMSSLVSTKTHSDGNHIKWGFQSLDSIITMRSECRNSLEKLLKSQKLDSILLQNAYIRALSTRNVQEIVTIITTLRINEFSINMTPRTGFRVTEQTSLMQLVQQSEYPLIDNSTTDLMMQQYEKVIALNSVTFPGDSITITGASALMIAAFRGNVEAVTRLTPEMGLVSDDGWTALMLAASEGHTECIQLLYGEINLCGFTMLMYAVACNDYERARRLIHLAGRQVSFKCDKGWSALMLAVKLGHYKIASLLVSEEARLQTTDDWINDYTALLVLSKYSQKEDSEDWNYRIVTDTLLKEEGDLRNEKGETPLMLAAFSGNIWLVQLICNHPNKWCVQVKAQSHEGETALMYAARRGHFEACTLLATNEARFATNNGKTALMFASEGGYSNIVHLLCHFEGGLELSDPLSAGKTALMFASEHGCIAVVRLLLNAEGGRCMRDGTTALMLAAVSNHDSVLNLLEVEARMQDNHGRTALILAAQAGSFSCVKILAAWEVNARDQYGNTALMHAARNGHTEIVSVLVSYEAGQTNINGYSALMIASEVGDINICKLLSREVGISNYTDLMFLVVTKGELEYFDPYKSQVGKYAINGMTALMLAAITNNVEAVSYLMEEVGAQDWVGNTALMYACKNGFYSIVEKLAAHEAELKNDDGMTALMLAAYYGKPDCLKYLLARERHITDHDGNSVDFYAKYPNHDDYNSKAQILALLDDKADKTV